MAVIYMPHNRRREHFVKRWLGAYRIAPGTVAKFGTPNVPGCYKVRVHHQASAEVVREMWTDRVTGAHLFGWLPADVYYLIAFDHTGEYGGVIETDVVAEPMP